MYAYLKGTIVQTKSDAIVLENNDIGYYLLCPTPYFYKLGQVVIVYTYLHVKEDVFALYGFKNSESVDLFKKLISVSGIGPKSAMSILACDDVDRIYQAIEAADAKFIQKFPGIGPKAASQIILDLKGKLTLTQVTNPIEKDAIEALVSLGYKKTDVAKALKSVDLDQSIELVIKSALAKMIRGTK